MHERNITPKHEENMLYNWTYAYLMPLYAKKNQLFIVGKLFQALNENSFESFLSFEGSGECVSV